MRLIEKGDVLGGQRRAILEGDAVTDGELHLCRRDLLPRRRDFRRDFAGIVARDEIVEDVAVDVVAVGVPLLLRVERGGLVHEVDGDLILGESRLEAHPHHGKSEPDRRGHQS